MDRGNARRICGHIEKNYGDLLNKLNIELIPVSDFMGQIEVLNPPSLFSDYMAGKGYCNRDKFFSYAPCDVLAFFVMAQERLFEDGEHNHEVSQLLGQKINVKELCGSTLQSTDLAIRLQSEIKEILAQEKPVLLDFSGVRSATFDFLLVAFGYFYKEEDFQHLDYYLVFDNLQQNQISNDLRSMRNDIMAFRNNPKLSHIANFLSN